MTDLPKNPSGISRLTPEERRARAQLAAHARWAKGKRPIEALPERDDELLKLEDEVDPDGFMSQEERTKRAENLRQSRIASERLEALKAKRAQ